MLEFRVRKKKLVDENGWERTRPSRTWPNCENASNKPWSVVQKERPATK